jgi:alkylation response protein AidB-like acyl-CoA dehydrogenase
VSINLFIKNEQQKLWLDKLEQIRPIVNATAQIVDEQNTFPHVSIKALKSIGYTKITLPTEYGGDGFSIYDAVLVQEKLGSFDGSTALIVGWTLLHVGEQYENATWKAEQLETFAEHIKNGAIVNRAVSEFAMGSPVRGGRPQTTAKREGTGWRINGRKNYTTGAPALDFFNTSVWIEEEEKVGFFLIPRETEGVSIEENWKVLSMRGTGSHDLVLENVYLQEDALVEVPSYSTGFKLNGWLLVIPATYLGIAQAARDYAVEFATKHSPNSIEGTIADLPNVQTLIGEMDIELTKARFTLYGAAEVAANPYLKKESINVVNIAKHVVTNAAITIVDKAMRLVGAKSLQLNNPLQRYYRDVRAGLHNPPMDDLAIKLVAQEAIQNQLNKMDENSK